MITFNWHELYRSDAPAGLETTGFDSPLKARYAVGDRVYAAQLDALVDTGLRIGLAHEAPDVVLTFDDGGISNRELAAPPLRERGLRAHFFVCPALLGTRGFLGPEDVRALAREGHAIGSHSQRHRPLTALSPAELRAELVESRLALEELLGSPCTALALPYGMRDERVLEASWEAGYRLVFNSTLPSGRTGRVLGRYTLQRDWTPEYVRALAERRVLATVHALSSYAASALLGRLQRRLLRSG